MSLAWHIALKDIRRLRWELVGWSLLIATKLAIGMVLLWSNTANLTRVGTLGLWAGGLMILEFPVGFLLVAALLHGDSVTGSTSFWRTRPISAMRLLGGKLLGLTVIFGVIPLLLSSVWWMICGYGAKDWMFAVLETLFWHGLVIVAAFPLAALTEGFSRFLTGAFVLIFGLVCLNLTVLPATRSVPMFSWVASASIRMEAAALCWLAFGLVAGLARFFRLRSWLAWGSLGTGVCLAVLASYFWPAVAGPQSNPFLPPLPEKPGPLSAGVRMSFDRANVVRNSAGKALIGSDVNFHDVPNGYFLKARGRAEHLWQWPNGVSLKASASISLPDRAPLAVDAVGLHFAPPDPALDRWREQLRLKFEEQHAKRGAAPAVRQDASEASQFVQIDAGYLPGLLRTPSRYQMEAPLSLRRYQIRWEQPLTDNLTMDAFREGERIAKWSIRQPSPRRASSAKSDVHQDAREWLIITVVRRGPLWWNQLQGSDIWTAFPGGDRSARSYFMADAARTVIGVAREVGRSIPVRVATVRILRFDIGIEQPLDFQEPARFVARAHWHDHATLFNLAEEEVESFMTKLSVDRFELEPQPEKGNQ